MAWRAGVRCLCDQCWDTTEPAASTRFVGQGYYRSNVSTTKLNGCDFSPLILRFTRVCQSLSFTESLPNLEKIL